jgi:hypothetical protein
MPWWLIGGFAGFFAGCPMTPFGLDELRLALSASSTPREISCAELAAQGPRRGAYVTLTDFTPRLEGYIYDSEQEGSPWRVVYVPLVPRVAAGAPLRPEDVGVIVKFNRVRSEEELRQALAPGRLTGCVVARGHILGNLRNLLQQGNPGIDLDRCWELQEAKAPWPWVAIAFAVLGGVLFFTLGCLCLCASPQQCREEMKSPLVVMVPLVYLVVGLHSLWQKLSDNARKNVLTGITMTGLLLLGLAMLQLLYGRPFRADGSFLELLLLGELLNFGMAFSVAGGVYLYAEKDGGVKSPEPVPSEE